MSLMVSSVPHAPNSPELEHSARREGHFFTTKHTTCDGVLCHVWTWWKAGRCLMRNLQQLYGRKAIGVYMRSSGHALEAHKRNWSCYTSSSCNSIKSIHNIPRWKALNRIIVFHFLHSTIKTYIFNSIFHYSLFARTQN